MMNERQNDLVQAAKDEHVDLSLDYGPLIIELVKKIDKNDRKFLMQVYTIVHRHIEKRGA